MSSGPQARIPSFGNDAGATKGMNSLHRADKGEKEKAVVSTTSNTAMTRISTLVKKEVNLLEQELENDEVAVVNFVQDTQAPTGSLMGISKAVAVARMFDRSQSSTSLASQTTVLTSVVMDKVYSIFKQDPSSMIDDSRNHTDPKNSMYTIARAASKRKGFSLFALLLKMDWRFQYFNAFMAFTFAVFMCADANAHASYSRGEDIDLTFYKVISLLFMGHICCELIVRSIGSHLPWKNEIWLISDIVVLLTWTGYRLLAPDEAFGGHGQRVGVVALVLPVVPRTLLVIRVARNLTVMRCLDPVHLMLKAMASSLEPAFVAVSLGCIFVWIGTFAMMAVCGPWYNPAAHERASEQASLTDVSFVSFWGSGTSIVEVLMQGNYWKGVDSLSLTAKMLFWALVCLGNFFLWPVMVGCFHEIMNQTKQAEDLLRLTRKHWDHDKAQQMRKVIRDCCDDAGMLTLNMIRTSLVAVPECAISLGWNLQSVSYIFARMDTKALGKIDCEEFIHAMQNKMVREKSSDMMALEHQQYRCHRELQLIVRGFLDGYDEVSEIAIHTFNAVQHIQSLFFLSPAGAFQPELQRLSTQHAAMVKEEEQEMEHKFTLNGVGTLVQNTSSTATRLDVVEAQSTAYRASSPSSPSFNAAHAAQSKEHADDRIERAIQPPKATISPFAAKVAVRSGVKEPPGQFHHPLMHGWFKLLQSEGHKEFRHEICNARTHYARLQRHQ